MNKLLVPSIITAIVLVAGMFALMPVERATTVHTSAINNQAQLIESGAISTATLDGSTTVTLDCTADYLLHSITMDLGASTFDADDEIDKIEIDGDLLGDTTDDIELNALDAGGVLEVIDGAVAGDAAEDVVVTITLGTDTGDEDIEQVKWSVSTSGTCTSATE